MAGFDVIGQTGEHAGSDLAQQEVTMQQQACSKQAAYNLAIEQVLEKRRQRQVLQQQRREQKQQDELAMQMYLRQRVTG